MMDEHSEATGLAHLINMNLATTPQQSFERAHRMLVQAATIRECAEDLQTRVQALYDKADALQEATFDLQGQGMQVRIETARVLEQILEQHRYILPGYNAAKPRRLPETALAVEEGHAFTEQVESFGDTLCAFTEFVHQNRDFMDTSVKGERDDIFEDAHQTILVPENVGPGFEELKLEEDTNTAFASEQSVDTSKSSDNEYQSIAAVPEFYDEAVTSIKNKGRNRKLQQLSEAEQQLKDDEEPLVYGEKRRPHERRGLRKGQWPASIGYDSEVDRALAPDTVEARPRKKAKKEHDQRCKGIHKLHKKRGNPDASKDGWGAVLASE